MVNNFSWSYINNGNSYCKHCDKRLHCLPKEDCPYIEHQQMYVDFLVYVRKRRNRIKQEVINRLGGKCVKCGATDIRILQINHLNGDGKEDHGSTYKSGDRIYLEIYFGRRDIKDLECRCANDNILYEYEFKRRVWD